MVSCAEQANPHILWLSAQCCLHVCMQGLCAGQVLPKLSHHAPHAVSADNPVYACLTYIVLVFLQPPDNHFVACSSSDTSAAQHPFAEHGQHVHQTRCFMSSICSTWTYVACLLNMSHVMLSCTHTGPSIMQHSYAMHRLQRALFEVHRRLLEGDYSMTAGSTAPVVTRFLLNQALANNLLQR